jgi:hypothetical protein
MNNRVIQKIATIEEEEILVRPLTRWSMASHPQPHDRHYLFIVASWRQGFALRFEADLGDHGGQSPVCIKLYALHAGLLISCRTEAEEGLNFSTRSKTERRRRILKQLLVGP